MDGRPTWTDSDEAGDYVVLNVLSPRYLVFRPDNMDETVPHTHLLCRKQTTKALVGLHRCAWGSVKSDWYLCCPKKNNASTCFIINCWRGVFLSDKI